MLKLPLMFIGWTPEEFGATDGLQPKYDGGDVKEYLRLHEKQKGHTAFVLVHKIPVSVFDRFPGMFQKDEIITPTNLIEIDSEFGGHATNDQGERLVPPHYVSSIGNLYAHWEQLFRNPKITKTEIIRYSESAIRSAR